LRGKYTKPIPEIISADVWEIHRGFSRMAIVIPTNGTVTHIGHAVMGRGLARDAAQKFPSLPKELGKRLIEGGNKPYYFPQYSIITFPVKKQWYEHADIELIRWSCGKLVERIKEEGLTKVYVPRVGCGNGKLDWRRVKPVLMAELSPVCVIVTDE